MLRTQIRNLVAVLCLSILFLPLSVLSDTHYVSPGGADHWPYTNWTDAATSVQPAIDASATNDIVLMTNGTYVLSTQISVEKAINVRSVNGANSTVIDGNDSVRCLLLTDAGAVVEGLTITRANSPSDGAILFEYGGMVSNCVVTNNTGVGAYFYYGGELHDSIVARNIGGGVNCFHMGTVSNCVMDSNIGNGAYCNNENMYVAVHNGGTIQNCLIISNTASGVACGVGGVITDCTIRENVGDGLNLSGSLADRCLVTRNGGNGVTFGNSGLIANSLISRNAGDGVNSGYGGGVVGCTIVSNIGIGIYSTLGMDSANNIILYHGTNWVNEGDRWSYSYTCTTPLVPGTGNISSDPEFVNPDDDDYHLRPLSPCIDTGAYQTGLDLEGNDRALNGATDLGSMEFRSDVGHLACNVASSVEQGLAPLDVVLTAHIAGANTNGLYYEWDLDNDGTNDASGFGLSAVTMNYATCGLFSVSFSVSNAVGEIDKVVKTDFIRVAPAVAYVSPAGLQVFPYTNWVLAATNIQSAIDAGLDGTKIVVTNGDYFLDSAITIERGITVQSANGPSGTIVHGVTSNCFFLNHPDAVLDGFTVTGGNAPQGGGVFCQRGLLQNCLLLTNSAVDGGGVYCLSEGIVSNCVLSSNSVSGSGGGAYCVPAFRTKSSDCHI